MENSIVVSVRLTPAEHSALAGVAAIAGSSVHRATKAAIAAYLSAGGTTRSASETARLLKELSGVAADLKRCGNLVAYAVKAGRPIDDETLAAYRTALVAVTETARTLVE